MESGDDLIGSLSPEQAAAVHAPDGPVMVSAGAGTGKTRTLVARIAWLLRDRGVDPSSVTAISFTNKAAREIRERLSTFLGKAGAEVKVGTFHGVAARILRRWPQAVGLRDRTFGIIDNDDSRILIAEAASASGAWDLFKPPPRPPEVLPELWEKTTEAARSQWVGARADYATSLARRISLWKSWGLSAADIEEPKRPRRDAEQERAARVYLAYREDMRSRNLVDFGDLVLEAVNLLEGVPQALEMESSAVGHLLVDEAQDVNQVQIRLARLLSSDSRNLFVVGDEDQGIMGFQASYPRAMQAMAGPAARVFTLSLNRRSTDEILKPANEVVNWNRRRGEPRKELRSERSGVPVHLVSYDTEIREAFAITERIAALLASGTSPSRIAILMRSGWLMGAVEEALVRKRIPFERIGGTALLEREEVKDLLAYVRLAVDPFDEMAFRRVANRPTRGIGPSAAEAVVGAAAASRSPLYEACLRVAKMPGLRQDGREGLTQVGRILEWLAIDGAGGRPTANIVEAVLKDTGYEEWLQRTHKDPSRRLDNVVFVRRLALDEDDASLFLQSIALMTDLDVASGTPKVRLSTIHSAKGLEFDHVFLPAWEAGVFPSQRAMESGASGKPEDRWDGPVGGGVVEERRLAHVALTRARDSVEVSYALTRTSSRASGGPSSLVAEANLQLMEAPGGDLRELKPSRRQKIAGGKGFARRRH